MSELTRILEAVRSGDPAAAEQLLPLVYQELRHLAASRMAREAPGQTLQPTALVHEAWLRLTDKQKEDEKWESKAQFFAAAAEAMRRILIEQARRKQSARHGGGQFRVDLNRDMEIPSLYSDDQLLAVNGALDELAIEHRAEAELVKLRFFAGMTIEESAQALNISTRTAKYYWTHARAWLFRKIQQDRNS